MKTMSQVSRMADCPENMDEARAIIAQLDREVKRLNSARATVCRFPWFAELLARNAVVDADAVRDPEGYDGGGTVARIAEAHREIFEKFNA